jgi:AcrR family transcriptional regulator
MAATLDIMLSEGYTAMTIPDIARAAGVHPTTIYRRWGTKSMLAVDAIAGVSTEIAPAPDTGSLRGDLDAFISSIARSLRVKEVREMVTSIVGIDEDGALEVRKAYWDARCAIIEKIFAQAIERGEIDRAPDAWTTIEIATAPIWMRALVSDRPISGELMEDLTARAVDFVFSETGSAG